MSQNKLITFMAALLVIAVFVIAIFAGGMRKAARDAEDTKRGYRQALKKSRHREDSLAELTKKSQARVAGLQAFVRMQGEELDKERVAKRKWQNEYAKAKNTRLPDDITDAQLDSAVTTLVRQHRRQP